MTDNELIAEFMGLPLTKQEPEFSEGRKLKTVPLMQWKYDTSWDWLMPVVEKISRHLYEQETFNDGYQDITAKYYAHPRTFAALTNEGNFMVRFSRMSLHEYESIIKAQHSAVVEFIKWSNQQKP